MIIYPAIDLKDGACVRLVKGDMARDTVYNEDPGAQAHEWAAAGFSWIHVVDLNGAIDGKPVNNLAVAAILKAADIPVQLGGGIRNLDQIEHWLSEGISRVILGTIAAKEPEIVKEACRLFPGQIAVGIDALNGEVMVDGWVEGSNIQATDLVKHYEDAGVCAVIYTDIDRDGTGEGVNVDSTVKLAESISIPVIASGGVGSLADIQAVKGAELSGVIVGKAFYDQRIDPREALEIAA